MKLRGVLSVRGRVATVDDIILLLHLDMERELKQCETKGV